MSVERGDSETSSLPAEAALLCAVFASLTLLYWLLRLPTRSLLLEYHDDAEALYHALTVLKGGVLYRDDHSHHFLGYVVQYLLGAKVFGFSPGLVRQVALVNQPLTALGVFLCARFFVSSRLSFTAACLALAAREPWVVGFYIQYQLNLLIVFVCYFCLRFVRRRSPASFAAACALCGLLITFDQRTLVVAALPFFAGTGPGRGRLSGRAWAGAAFAFLLPLLLAAGYLYGHGVWPEFVEQTLVYPARYRIGSLSLWEALSQGLLLHRPLFSQTPVHTLLGAAGWCALLYHCRPGHNGAAAERQVLAAAALPLAVLPLFGLRRYDYYTVTWLPYLSLMAVLSPWCFPRVSRSLRRVFEVLLWLPVAVSVGQAASNANWLNSIDYKGDGAAEVVSYLRQVMTDADDIYVWGYRPDLYVRLNRVSSLPFMNYIMIHPDHSIVEPDARRRHVFPKYLQQFLNRLQVDPPKFIVTVNQEDELPSSAHTALLDLLRSSYRQVLETEREDFRRRSVHLQVFQLRTNGGGLPPPSARSLPYPGLPEAALGTGTQKSTLHDSRRSRR